MDLCDWPFPLCPHLPRLCLNVTAFLSETVCRARPGTQQVLHKCSGVRTKKGDGPWTAGRSCLPAPQGLFHRGQSRFLSPEHQPGTGGDLPDQVRCPLEPRPCPPKVRGRDSSRLVSGIPSEGRWPAVPGASGHTLSRSGQALGRIAASRPADTLPGARYSCLWEVPLREGGTWASGILTMIGDSAGSPRQSWRKTLLPLDLQTGTLTPRVAESKGPPGSRDHHGSHSVPAPCVALGASHSPTSCPPQWPPVPAPSQAPLWAQAPSQVGITTR